MSNAISTSKILVSASEAAQSAPREQPIHLATSKDTRLLNKWLVLRPKLAVTKIVLPIKMNLNKTGVMPLRERPDMPNRTFKYSVKLVPIEVTWDPKEPKQWAAANTPRKRIPE
jgi:hypothetical protein